MQIKESAENYLETILMLKNTRGYVRSVDIANALGFSKPSVSVAMKHFRAEGLIVTGEDGSIALTEKGMEIASNIYTRHQLIASFLMHIGVSEQTALEDSCKLEHHISAETFDKLKAWMEQNKSDNP